MHILDRRDFLKLSAAAGGSVAFGLAASGPARAATADVFTGDPFGGLVDSVVVAGEKKLLLIDAQFTVPNATRLADMIAATGKELETIYITHFHPDHHLGLSVLMKRFPSAKPVAHAAIQPSIAGAAKAMLDGMKATMPPELFGDDVVIPDALSGDKLTLEGETFDIIGPLHGDTAQVTAVHMPQLKTLVASDVVYHDTHIWTAENTKPEEIAKWRDSLRQLESIGAQTVIPGHRTEASVNDASAFAFMNRYLDAWEGALASAKTAGDLKAAMIEKAGALPGEFFLDRGVAAARP